jgi:hypothetical protein
MLVIKAPVSFLLVAGTLAGAQNIVRQTVHPDRVTEIRTALDHISVIALPERILRIAAGSQSMQIEWHGEEVFIKPLQSGQATDLMVWTEHQFSAYELEAPGDVKQMTLILDETKSPIPQSGDTAAHESKSADGRLDSAADSAIGSTLLRAATIQARGVRSQREKVNVLIKEVVRDGDWLYVRFAVTNLSALPFRILSPNVFEITARRNSDLLRSIEDEQITDKTALQFQPEHAVQVTVRRAEIPQKDLASGATAEGVVEIRPESLQVPKIYEFVFGSEHNHMIKATVVL